MISRRTITFLLIALACFGVLTYRTWEQERPCREWRLHQGARQPETAPVLQPDGSFSIAFNPCYEWREMAWQDKTIALVGFAASVAFIISLLQDLLIWWKKAKALRALRN